MPRQVVRSNPSALRAVEFTSLEARRLLSGPRGEGMPTESAPTPAPTTDGGVSFADLLSLAQEYGSPVNSPGGDWMWANSNVDNSVNFADLLALAQNYDAPTGWTADDVNRDGVVNFTDLLALAQGYGSTGAGGFANEWALAQNLATATPVTITGADRTAAEADRAIVCVSDLMHVVGQTKISKNRVRVDFALPDTNAVSLSLTLVRKSVVIMATQDVPVRVVGFDSRKLEQRLPTSGKAYVVGSNKRFKLAGSIASIDDRTAGIRVAGGLIKLPRDRAGASAVLA